MIQVLCPSRHLVTSADINNNAIVPQGPQTERHGLTWDYEPEKDCTRFRAACSDCWRGWSVDYDTVRDGIAAAIADGRGEYQLPGEP